MERLYSSQKTYINTKRFTLKSLLAISLFIALITIPELKAQKLVINITASVSASQGELISYTIQYANTGFVATTNRETTDCFPYPYEILPQATYCNILNLGIGERPIKGYVYINHLNNS